MKLTKQLLFIFLSSAILFGCSYDDTDIWSEIDKIKTDLTSLNKQVTSIETIVDALNAGKVITKIDPLEGDKGYKITFNDAKTVDILHGEKAPVVGIRESEEVYYWTITTNGKTDFLLDAAGNKLPVSGETPTLSIDKEGYWTVNNALLLNAKGEPVKAQGDSFFKEVIEEDDSVTFMLANGNSIVLPKSGGTYLRFDSEEDEPAFTFYPGEQKRLHYTLSNVKSLEVIEQPRNWTVNLVGEEKYIDVTASPQSTENAEKIVLRGLDNNGLVFMAIAQVRYKKIDFANPQGVYILNEGSFGGDDKGSLLYITPDKYAIGQIYYNINGRAPGDITQDLFIKDDKMYIIAQNRNELTDGRLVVADAATMKKVANYDDELASLILPTHLAVLNEDNIFIRDNDGVYLFDSKTKRLTFIEGTDDANKNSMAVADNKVFVPASKKILVLEAGKLEVVHTIDMEASVSGVLRAKDGNLWVATTGNPQKISKINSKDYSLIRSNEITEGTVGASFAATPGITAKGDTLYHGGLGTKIYRHIFTTGETKLMADAKEMTEDATIVYNTVAVHPLTGIVYMNTIKGFGEEYKINNIIEFDFSGDTPEVIRTYKNHTRFPAGIFFSANFN